MQLYIRSYSLVDEVEVVEEEAVAVEDKEAVMLKKEEVINTEEEEEKMVSVDDEEAVVDEKIEEEGGMKEEVVVRGVKKEEVLDVTSVIEGDRKGEVDTRVEMLLIIVISIIGDEEEREEKKEVIDDEIEIGDEDIEETMEVEGINEDEKKLSIEDTSLLLGNGVVTVVVTIGISIELFDTVINDEVLKPFLMEKRRHHTKHHDDHC